jgi:mono/diheme cytochrome c family protein
MYPRTAVWLAAVAAAASLAGGALAVASKVSVPGNAVVGKALFLRAGLFCASCHALKAAGSTGRDGQNLDRARPGYATIVQVVTKGRSPSRRWPTGMPGYGGLHGEVSKALIQDIAAFVYTATHR